MVVRTLKISLDRLKKENKTHTHKKKYEFCIAYKENFRFNLV